MGVPATDEAIVQTFLRIPYADRHYYNWGTAGSREEAVRWHAGDETYINGIILTVDMDYVMGYLIEAVDRESGNMRFLVVVVYHGPRPDGSYEHDFVVYNGPTGTFFDREVEQDEIALWGVSRIYNLVDAWRDARRAGK